MRWLTVVWLVLWAAFSMPWTSATSVPRWDRIKPPRVNASSRVRADHVFDVLFYTPVAPLGSDLGLSLPVCVLAGSVLSLTAETAQLFSSGRNPDGNDLIANVAGTTVGVTAVLLYRRRNRHHRALAATSEHRP